MAPNFETPAVKGGGGRTKRIQGTGSKINCHRAITGNIGTAILLFSNTAFENKSFRFPVLRHSRSSLKIMGLTGLHELFVAYNFVIHDHYLQKKTFYGKMSIHGLCQHQWKWIISFPNFSYDESLFLSEMAWNIYILFQSFNATGISSTTVQNKSTGRAWESLCNTH